MPKQILTDLDFVNASRITNLPNATTDQEPATLAQLKAQIEGLQWKDNVKVKTQANIDLAAPGATVGGVTLSASERFLAAAQDNLTQNGIYIYNGVSTPATRSPDASTMDELTNAIASVDSGAEAGTTWRQATVGGTLGSANIVWTPFGVVTPPASETTAGKIEIATQVELDAGIDDERAVTPLKLATWNKAPKRYQALVGDGSNTSYAVTHNLGTRDLEVKVYRNSGNYDEVMVETRMTSTNQVTLVFSSAPATNAFRVVVIG
jgi:hypothetical protein